MTFKWETFCEVSIHLYKYNNSEQYQRSSVGRLYYACFGKSKEYYENYFQKTLATNDGHSVLISTFESSDYKIERDLGKYLRKLRNLRNHADYRENEFKTKDMMKSKKNAKNIFKILKELDKNPIRSPIP